MPKKEIELLKAQIQKLDAKDFDLEAWKKYTIIILARIFGDTSQKVRQIEGIEYDFSSWSLRDTTGSSSYIDTCKKLGMEILEASIEELKTFGLPEQDTSSNAIFDAVMEALEDELKGHQFKEIRKILQSASSPKVKRSNILEKLKSYGNEVSTEVLAKILSTQAVINKINK